jgi:purine-nucleoside phosphorylase
MSTPHNSAEKGDFAKTVLMPGDPLRAKFVAENFLTNPKLVTEVRNVYGYTGEYKGKPISVMASGMGMPSISIYASELFDFYDVENIIRFGTCGSIQPSLNVGDIILAAGASYDSNIMNHYHLPGTLSAIPKFSLLKKAVEEAEKSGKHFEVGNILSEDTFYNDTADEVFKWQKMGVLGLEMESAALYAIAARRNKGALGLFTVSDSLITHEEASPEDRQKSFTAMMRIALETGISA